MKTTRIAPPSGEVKEAFVTLSAAGLRLCQVRRIGSDDLVYVVLTSFDDDIVWSSVRGEALMEEARLFDSPEAALTAAGIQKPSSPIGRMEYKVKLIGWYRLYDEKGDLVAKASENMASLLFDWRVHCYLQGFDPDPRASARLGAR